MRKRNLVVAGGATVLVALASVLPTAAENWPQWRGPNRDGLSQATGLLQEWSQVPQQVWKANGLGAGYSGVSIADGRVITMGDRSGAQYAIALSLANGDELWSAKIDEVWAPTGYSGPRCTPTIDGDLVYVIGTKGNLVCLDVATGKERWRKNFATDFSGKMMSGWGYSESPLVDDEKLVCTPGGRDAALVALDKETGAEIWRSRVPELGENGKDGAAYSSIVISQACGTRQYVQLIGRGVVGIEAATGRFLWGYNRVANDTANIPTPIVSGDYVFSSTGYGTGSALLKLVHSDDGIDAQEVYFLDAKHLQNHHGGLILVGDYLYGGHGHNKGFPTCVELQTGKRMWDKDRGPGEGSAAVGYADGHLYFRYQNGVVALIDASPSGYRLRGTFTIPNVKKPSWPHPTIVDGKLYLREQDALYCYNVSR